MEKLTIDLESCAKIYKIKNSRGRIMFLVEFLIKEDRFIVKVREVTNLDIPFDVIRTEYKFDTEEQKQIQKEKALKNLQKLIQDYQCLVNSIESEQVTPEKVFIEAVNYRRIDPDCCLNCENSKIPSCISVNMMEERKILCSNKANMRQYDNIWEEFAEGGSYRDCKYVIVDENGMCNNYKRCGTPRQFGFDPRRYLRHDHDLIDLIKTMQENRLVEFEDEIYIKNGEQNPKFKSNVISVFGELSNQISGGVDRQVLSAHELSIINISGYIRDFGDITQEIIERKAADAFLSGVIDRNTLSIINNTISISAESYERKNIDNILSGRIDKNSLSIENLSDYVKTMGDVTQERAERIAADQYISSLVIAETQTRVDADQFLSGKIDINANKIAANEQAIHDEEQTRISFDTALSEGINYNNTLINWLSSHSIKDLSDMLCAEIILRDAIDRTLCVRIDENTASIQSEQTSRQSEIGFLSGKIDDNSLSIVNLSTYIGTFGDITQEIAERKAADAFLSGKIDENRDSISIESQKRDESDTYISGMLNDEINIRAQQYTELGQRIDNISVIATSAFISTITSAVLSSEGAQNIINSVVAVGLSTHPELCSSIRGVMANAADSLSAIYGGTDTKIKPDMNFGISPTYVMGVFNDI